jgi:hypothetical protein
MQRWHKKLSAMPARFKMEFWQFLVLLLVIEPAGLTIPLANETRNIFQRLFRNRGEDERATSYRRYVYDLHGLMGGS